MTPGNVQLVDYGIQTERSDFRAHVCPIVRRVYLYPTWAGNKAILSGEFKQVQTETNGIITAEGFLVPPHKISGCLWTTGTIKMWEAHNVQETDSEEEKGRKAVSICIECFHNGRFALPIVPEPVRDRNRQIAGADLILPAQIVQVKCDYRGGLYDLGGTGFLFLQIKECNPGHRH